MKKLISFQIVFLMALVSFAQIQKGAVLLKGDLNFSIVKQDNGDNFYYVEQEQTSFGFSPGVGIFVSDKLLLGAGVNLNYLKVESLSNPIIDPGIKADSKTKTILFNSYLSYYTSIGEKFYFNVSANGYVGVGENKSNNYKSNIFQASIQVSPGVNYFINEKWALTAFFGSIYYSYSKEDPRGENDGGESESKNFGLSLKANTLSVGIQYFIGAKSIE